MNVIMDILRKRLNPGVYFRDCEKGGYLAQLSDMEKLKAETRIAQMDERTLVEEVGRVLGESTLMTYYQLCEGKLPWQSRLRMEERLIDFSIHKEVYEQAKRFGCTDQRSCIECHLGLQLTAREILDYVTTGTRQGGD